MAKILLEQKDEYSFLDFLLVQAMEEPMNNSLSFKGSSLGF